MTTYEPGTVAMVTYEGERCRAFKDCDGSWSFAEHHQHRMHCMDEETLSDITPLPVGKPGQVLIDATREDAERIQKALRYERFRDASSGDLRMFLAGLVDAIREQTPELLVIPENLGAVVETNEGGRMVRVGHGGLPWFSVVSGCRFSTDRIRKIAVRVLSEGVPS